MVADRCGQPGDNRAGSPLALYAEASRRGWAEGKFTLPRIWQARMRPRSSRRCRVTSSSMGSPARLGCSNAGRAANWAILALANKESLVVGGALVTSAAKSGSDCRRGLRTLRARPSLRGGSAAEVDRLILTASGGPSVDCREEMSDVTPDRPSRTRPGTWAG